MIMSGKMLFPVFCVPFLLFYFCSVPFIFGGHKPCVFCLELYGVGAVNDGMAFAIWYSNFNSVMDVNYFWETGLVRLQF